MSRLVFRFPKTQVGIGQLLTELTLLRMVRGHLTLAVPDPVFFNTDTNTVGEVFAGHRMVPGEPLKKHVEILKVIPPAHLNDIADGLADFMRELHSVPIPHDAHLPVHDSGRQQSVAVLRDQVRGKLAAYLPVDRKSHVFAEFERFINDPRSFDFQRALKHGDLGPGNLLINPAADVGFVMLWGTHLFGALFAERVLTRYGADESLRARAGFFKMAIALSVALAGLESGNTDDLEFGLSACS
jgi:aminoglycoside phosphotransferase (APT) family kinase protein